MYAGRLRAAALAAMLCLAGAVVLAADPKASRYYEDALTRYEKRDYAGAIVQLKNALQADRTLLPVHVLLGKALAASGDAIAAEVAFDEALRLGVNRAEVVLPLADAVVAQGKPQLLLEQSRFSDAGLPGPVRAQLLVMRANAAVDTGDVRGAMKAIDDARAIDPQRPESWLAEVPIRLRAQQTREAAQAAERAVGLAPTSAQAVYLRGTVAHAVGDRTGALAYYDRALQMRPGHTEALVARAGLLLDLGRLPAAARDLAELRKQSAIDPRVAYMRSVIAEREGKPAEAKAALGEVTALLDRVPLEFLRYRPQLLILGGLAHFGLDQRGKAKPYLELASRGQPGAASAKLLAQIYLGEKNQERAITTLEAYLKEHPTDPGAMQLLASAHMAQGRYARATALVQDALKLQDTPALHSLLGLSLVGTGKFAPAVTELEAAFKADPGQTQAGSALVSIYMQSGQTERAVRHAETLAKAQPKNAALRNLLGSARLRADDDAGAREAFESALLIDPAFLAPQVNLAQLDLRANALDSAIARLNAVLAKNDKYVEALIEMGRVHERRGQLPEAQRYFEKADDHSPADSLHAALTLVDFQLRNRRPELARDALKRLTGRAPEAMQVLLVSARVQLANGDTSTAKSNLTRAANLANYDAPTLVQIAMLQLSAGHVPGAAYSLDKALSENPDYLPAHALLTDVEIRQGELAKADARVRKILAKYPKAGIGYALMGDIAMARKQRPAALDAYRRAHQLEQSSDSLLRVYNAMAGNDAAGATQFVEQWVQAHPRDVAARRVLADAHARAGNLQAARTAYEEVLKRAPDDSETLNNLANVLILLKDPGALKLAEDAMARRPGVPHIIGTAGWAAFQAGQADRALQLLRDARLRDPDNADTRYFLGAVLASKGRKAEAREELEAALRGGNRFASAKAADELLRTLK